MKIRTSIKLSKELLIEVDALAGKKHNRSEIVETALRDYVARENRKESRKELNQRDIELINENAEILNKQVLETLEYQVDIWENYQTK